MTLRRAPATAKADLPNAIGEIALTLGHAPANAKANPPDAFEKTAITLGDAPSTVKLRTLKDPLSWLFTFCTLLMFASVIRTWSHWSEISASLGFVRAAAALSAVTGAALGISWWLNRGDE